MAVSAIGFLKNKHRFIADQRIFRCVLLTAKCHMKKRNVTTTTVTPRINMTVFIRHLVCI